MKEINECIRQYEGLFYKVLKRCGIFKSHVLYEDYLQELRILFYQKAENYQSLEDFQKENDVTYLFRYLLWKVIDLQRKELKEPQLTVLSDQEETPAMEGSDYWLTFQEFWQLLTKKERGWLLEAFFETTKSKQIRYYRLKKLKRKWLDFLKE